MQLLKKLIPPDNWKLPVILALGVFFPESLENLLNEIVYELGYL